MSCSLLSLPAELHLKIIEDLLRDKDLKAHEYKQDEPINIDREVINWSCTCSYFRGLLAPNIFKTAILVNDEKSGSSVKAVAKSPHNVHVKDLHFIGSALGDAHTEEAAFSDTEGVLPHSVEALLSNLQWFPFLQRLSIKFDYKFANFDEWNEGLDLGTCPETPQEVLEAEASAAWRALMSRTFEALTKNKPPNFKHLEIRQLHSKHVSTFSDASFHEYLNHLEQFTLSIHGENSGEWMSCVSEEYPARMEMLDEDFFNHLANVTILSIKAPKEGPLGLEGGNYMPLALKADQMPLLATLHLDYIFASPELNDFLVGHKDTLEELVLCNCYASTSDDEGLAENGIHWSQIFTPLFSAHPPRLRRLELIGRDMRGLLDKRDFTEEQYEQVRTVHRQDPERIMFPYAFLDFACGTLYYDEHTSLKSLLNGEDQRSWDRLVELVKRNAEEATKREIMKLQVQ